MSPITRARAKLEVQAFGAKKPLFSAQTDAREVVGVGMPLQLVGAQGILLLLVRAC